MSTQESVTNYKTSVATSGLPKNESSNSEASSSNPGSATEEALMAAERLFGCKIIRQVNPEGLSLIHI